MYKSNRGAEESNYSEVREVERGSLAYETQVSEILNQIDRLEKKVEHISLQNETRDASTPKEIKPALNSALDDIIERLNRVIYRINN